MSRTLLLSIIWCCWLVIRTTAGATENLDDVSTNNTLLSYVCDDGLLRGFDHRLEQLATLLEIIRSKTDLLQLRLEQQSVAQELRFDTSIQKLVSGIGETRATPACAATACATPAPAALPASCAKAVVASGRSGIHRLQPDHQQPPFLAPCLADEAGGAAWTLVQRRQDGSIDFYRNWTDYQSGFGNLAGEFFIGLDRLHDLTHSTLHELCIQLEDFDGAKRRACYDAFAIGDESHAYALELLGKFSGDAGDSLHFHQGAKFTTKDVHNDINPSNCAVAYRGAWWYQKCHASNLNGLYLKGEYTKDKYAQGVVWNSWRGHYYSYKYVHMAIRPVA